MNRPFRSLSLCCAWLVLLFSTCLQATASTSQEQVLSITDLHFSPFADPALTPKLAELPGQDWDAFLAQHAPTVLPAPGTAANYFLFDTVLDDASARVPRPRFILFSGDLLAHHFNRSFHSLFPDAGEQALEDFITATAEFIIDKVGATFPGIPVLFTLGNTDAFAGDYALIDGGRFLQRTAALFSEGWLQTKSARAAFLTTYPAHGYYSLMLPYQPDAKLISLSSVVFAPNYPWDDAEAVANAQLDWLESELAQAAAEGLRVWLLLHIPSSADIFATLSHDETRMQWRSAPLERFLGLVREYSDSIVFAQTGHTHMDDFRLVFADDRQIDSLAFLHITPSISPIFGNNPAYQIYDYDHLDAAVTGITTYYLDLAEPLCHEAGCRWRREYSFDAAYGSKPDRRGFEGLYRWIPDDREDQKGYINRYSVSITPPAIEEHWRAYWCGIAALTVAEFEARCSAYTSSSSAAVSSD